MSTGAIIFWILSWGLVLGLLGWSYSIILSRPRHFDPDGIGPDQPPQSGRAERDRPRR